jgi:small subunit ribosomal protein S3
VGQKTHPTGFRLGIYKKHNATWFANYGAYSKVLEEDYKIRQFFEKEFGTVYSKAGISKLEINRKVNQLELLIHAARPKAIAVDSGEEQSITRLKEKLKKFLKGSKQIRIKVIQIAKSENESSLVARSIADQLEKRVAFRRAVRQTTQSLQKSGVKGYRIQVSGRLNGAEIARAEWVKDGRVPGIKVWIFNKEIL